LLAAVARRTHVPYPALLALAGATLALLPGTPSVTLDPELALALFVAPVLLDAAFDSSPRDLKQNWRAVTGLALAAVGLTVAAVALVARWLVPDMPWAAAIALGAIVAPPGRRSRDRRPSAVAPAPSRPGDSRGRESFQ
jgi:CPA1 family monovalent cation:H+ antiporter